MYPSVEHRQTRAVMPQCEGVLIVEDDPDIRDCLRGLLEFDGYRVGTAGNGQEGLDWLSHEKLPCLILLDMMMPVMSGPEFLDAKRVDDRLAQIPVVVVSAYGRVADVLPGVDGVLKKPIDIDALLAFVKRYCPFG